MKSYKKTAVLVGLVIMSMFMLPVSAYQFSMTNIENYDSLTDLYPDGSNSHAYIYNGLTGQGWSEQSYQVDSNVDDTDFATSGGGLNNVDLHYHFGHGDQILSGGSWTTDVQYTNYPNSDLTRSEVYKKWGSSTSSPNKWVVLDSCWVLNDLQWGGALKYSHGILGFASYKSVNSQLASNFIWYASDLDYTLSYAWQRATTDALYGYHQTGRVIFDTENQLQNDHLPGHGSVSPSETLDDNTIYYADWMT
jgi:hypothetical protein